MARTSIKILFAVLLTFILLGISVLKTSLSGHTEKEVVAPKGITALKSPPPATATMTPDSVRVYADSLRILRNYYESRIEQLNNLYMAAATQAESHSDKAVSSTADADKDLADRYTAAIDTLQEVLKREEMLRRDSLRTNLMREYDSLVATLAPDLGPLERAAAIGRLTLDLSKKYSLEIDSLPQYLKK